MGLRSIKRQIAKARMAAMGVDRINKRMSKVSKGGLPNWRRAISGESGEAAHKAQIMNGRKIKRIDESRKLIKKRRIRKVTA